MAWWDNLTKRAKLIYLWGGAFTAFVTAIFSLTQVITATESWHPAFKGWVRNEIARGLEAQSAIVESVSRRQADGQLETVEVRRGMLEKELFELDLTMQSQPNLPDAIKGQLNTRKTMLLDDKKNLDFRYEQLQRARTGQRP